LLTTWTIPQSHGDYANRQWNGLLGGFYLKRWQMWLDALNGAAQFNESAVRKQIQDWEYAWTRQHNLYATEPAGDVVEISQRLYKRYRDQLSSP
jgi:alpha-N-acetylglucosaminidase